MNQLNESTGLIQVITKLINLVFRIVKPALDLLTGSLGISGWSLFALIMASPTVPSTSEFVITGLD